MHASKQPRAPLYLTCLLGGTLLMGCGGSAFHDHWDQGRFDSAARAFRSDSALRQDARALVRMAVLQLSAELPFHDPSAARDNLRVALELDPEPAVRRKATVLLELSGDVSRLRHQLEALKSIDLEGTPDDTTSVP